MTKRQQENFRTDELTALLLTAMQDQTNKNKSDLIRSAIFQLAKKELSSALFTSVLLKSIEGDVMQSECNQQNNQ